MAEPTTKGGTAKAAKKETPEALEVTQELRAQMAAMIMSGVIATSAGVNHERDAEAAVKHTDALLAELAK